MAALADIKAWVGADPDIPAGETATLTALLAAAKAYLAGAGVPASWDGTEPYDTAVKMLVATWYQHRDGERDTTRKDIPFGVTAIIHQMSGTTPPTPDPDPEEPAADPAD